MKDKASIISNYETEVRTLKDDLSREKQIILKQSEDLNNIITDKENKIKSLTEEIGQAKENISLKSTEITELQLKKTEGQDRISELESEIVGLNESAEKARAEHAEEMKRRREEENTLNHTIIQLKNTIEALNSQVKQLGRTFLKINIHNISWRGGRDCSEFVR